jgi:uncharacterized protein involved in outer membrane biogenesis
LAQVSLPRRGGFIVGGFFFLLVIAALVTLAWIIFLPRVVTESVSRLTGCATSISQLHVNPFTGHFEASGVRLGNPPGWGEDALIEIPHLSGRVALGSIADPVLVIETARVDVARLVLVVAANGKTNFEAIGPALSAAGAESRSQPRYAHAGLPSFGEVPSSVKVQELLLRVGRIEVIDQGVQPAQILADELAYEYLYQEVTRYEQLLTPELLARLAQSPALWKILINNGLLDGLGVESGGLQQLWQRAEGAVKSFLQGLEQTEKP